jgi:hypothetical protein
LNYWFSTPELDAGGEIRFLFAMQPDRLDYYYVSVTRDRLELGKVERGVELPLADWDGGGAFAKPQSLTVLQRPAKLAVMVGARKAVEVVDDTLEQGGAAVGARGASAPRVRARQAGGIYAADDFRRTRDDASAWEPVSGHWAVESLKNPNLSANAFSYAGRPSADGPGVALLGESWWDDYEFAASVRATGLNGFGLVFRHHGPGYCYVLRHVTGKGGAALQLVRIVGGTETVLKTRPAALAAHRWYRFRVSACGPSLRASVDGNLAFELRDDAIALGRVGLYIADSDGAEFDDVHVRGQVGAIGDFANGQISWYAKGGSWNLESTSSGQRLVGIGPTTNGPAAGKLLAGEESWADYCVGATLAADTTGPAGIVFRYHDEADHDLFLLHDGVYRLIEVRDGAQREVSRAPAPALTASRDLLVETRGGVIACKADGERVLAHFDDALRGGKAGLVVGSGGRASFEEVEIWFPQESEPVLTQLDTFAREATMKGWAAAESDWQLARTTGTGGERAVRWHRGSFPGGGRLRVAALFASVQPGSLHLFTGCTIERDGSRATLRRGYELIASTVAGEDEGRLVLLRDGKEVATARTADLRGKTRLDVQPVAGHVLASVNNRVVLAYRDREPLEGWHIGYAAEGVTVQPEDISVHCDRTRSYSFVLAPADWRPAGGEWEITNRWRCDPRWSFFGGENMQGVCGMWNKTVVEGDVTLEFAAGIRHQTGHGGYDRFVANMNAVICGDGADLSSGYGFVYGGWGNTKTAILRNGEVVASVSLRIPTGGIHRRWFYHKITKRSGRIRWLIDNSPVLEYEDPKPMSGGQVALWTWKNGLMVARVRIAGERVGALEHFSKARPSLSRCIYDP